MSSQRLRREISMLGDLLGDIIAQIHGSETLDLIERIRRLSRDARGGDTDAAQTLRETIGSLELEEMRLVIRGFSVFLDLTNLAEDRERIRVLRDRTRDSAPNPRPESIRAAVQSLKEAGHSAEAIQQLINRLDLELVLTAHPTEAKRRSLRSKLRSIREILYELDFDRPSEDRRKVEVRLRSELVKLWQTDFMRPWRPSVLQEVARGLAIAPNLWETVPGIFQDLRQALAEYYPGSSITVTPFLRYGSWIGGDRDGHPHVTADVSSQTLQWLREAALDFHIGCCEKLAESLSMSRRQSKVSEPLVAAVNSALSSWPEVATSLATVPEDEVYRRLLHVIHWRLLRTRDVRLDQGPPSGAYRTAAELQHDVEIMANSLRQAPTHEIAEAEVEPWCDQIATFGFHFARLDIRQDSSVHTDVMNELLRDGGIEQDFQGLDEPARQRVLLDSMGQSVAWNETQVSPEAQETLSLFRLLRRAARAFGMEAIGGHVVSMTRAPSDLLAVVWLWRWSASVDGGDSRDPNLRLPAIPLFETIDDLTRSAETTEALMSLPEYRDYVAALGNRQVIMVGYSDSTKDGGYLSACWALYEAQREMFKVTERHGVRLMFFHGRGGSLGRGGGPAARGIRSLPSRTFDGSLRLTEQGEVLAERYDYPPIASRHLEQIAWSAFVSAAEKQDEVEAVWIEVMRRLAESSRAAYRRLVNHEGFVDFFRLVTPIGEIERLPIGSRPSRRQGGQGLKDLRAIPWVFSWTQVRCLVPAWFGIGAAVGELIEQSPDAAVQLKQMYQKWSFVQAWVDNASVALSKTDLGILKRYAALADDDAMLEVVAADITEEFAATQRAMCLITDRQELLSDVQWLAESIRVRNRYVDPLNLIQVELLRRSRAARQEDSEDKEMQHLIRLSIKGIAAGMRATG